MWAGHPKPLLHLQYAFHLCVACRPASAAIFILNSQQLEELIVSSSLSNISESVNTLSLQFTNVSGNPHYLG